MALNPNWNEQATTTLNAWASTSFADVFSSHNALWWMLRKNSKVQTGGLGIKIIEPLKYWDPNGPAVEGTADPYTELIPSETFGWTSAEFAWCEKRLSVSIPQLTLDQQGPATQKINHLESVREINMMKFMETLAIDIWAGESTSGSAGQSRLSLGSILTYINRGGSATTNTTQSILTPYQSYAGTLGGVTVGGSAVNSSGVGTAITNVGNIERNGPNGQLWCSSVINPASADTVSLDVFHKGYNLSVRGQDHADIIITTQANYGALQSIMSTYQRYDGKSVLADAGFDAIKFRGAEVVFDDRCPAATALFLNTNYLKLRCASMKPVFELKPDPYRTIVNWQARWVGQVTSGNTGRVQVRHANVGS